MDNSGWVVQTAPMTRIVSLFFLLAPGAVVAQAQQAPASTEHTVTIQLQPKTPLNDNATLVSAINASYYHPDALSSVACDIDVDWPVFFHTLKVEVPPERMKTIQALKIHMNAQRGKTAEVAFDWADGTPNGGQEQIESGLKQMVGGFFQFYWSMAAATFLQNPSEITKTEQIPYGALKIYTSSGETSTVIAVDKYFSPTNLVVEAPSMKINLDMQYLPSPKPTSGDLRRLSNIDVDEQIGASNIKAGIGFDYQSAGDFFVPQHILFNVPGAYSIKMALSNCTPSK
jgi:hypothetical protein